MANGGHLDTGIFGTQFFFEVLSENGLHELAFEAMNKRTHRVTAGGLNRVQQPPGKDGLIRFRNHPMFGGGIVWFYRKLAGMNTDPENPGYRNIIFRPQPAKEISSASYSNITPYGTGSVKWNKSGEKFSMDILVPVGCTSTVFVPEGDLKSVTEGGKKSSVIRQLLFNGRKTGMPYSRPAQAGIILSQGFRQ